MLDLKINNLDQFQTRSLSGHIVDDKTVMMHANFYDVEAKWQLRAKLM